MRHNWRFASTSFTLDTRKSPLTMESLPDMVHRLSEQERANNMKLGIAIITGWNEDAKHHGN